MISKWASTPIVKEIIYDNLLNGGSEPVPKWHDPPNIQSAKIMFVRVVTHSMVTQVAIVIVIPPPPPSSATRVVVG